MDCRVLAVVRDTANRCWQSFSSSMMGLVKTFYKRFIHEFERSNHYQEKLADRILSCPFQETINLIRRSQNITSCLEEDDYILISFVIISFDQQSIFL